jgi:hypothetical protein
MQKQPYSPLQTALAALACATLLLMGAPRAQAIAISLQGVEGQLVQVGDQVTVTVLLDTEGQTGITLLSVGVLFDDSVLAYNEAASSSNTGPRTLQNGETRPGAGYILYGTAKAGGNYLSAAGTCGGGYGSPTAGNGCQLTLPGQVNVDYVNGDLSAGTGSTNVGVALMATLVFDVIGDGAPASGLAAVDLSITSPDNGITYGANDNGVSPGVTLAAAEPSSLATAMGSQPRRTIAP